MAEEKKPRRAKGKAAIGDIYQTKVVVAAMISDEAEERRKKTERLRALRVAGASETIRSEV